MSTDRFHFSFVSFYNMSTESVCTPSLDLLADSPPLSATAPYENYKDSPSTSPVKKKTKYNDEENLFTDVTHAYFIKTHRWLMYNI